MQDKITSDREKHPTEGETMEGADQFRSSTCGGLHPDELIVDNFAGGGGASTGIYLATGRHPDIAINHDREALAIYRANHPSTRVMCEDVFDVDPRLVTGRRRVGLAWFSPDCTFFSKARGAKPHRDRNRARRRRGLAGVVIKWAAAVRPRVICVENVEEFKKWGPLAEDGRPCPKRLGESFRRWHLRLVNLGYAVEWQELRACDYGAPTSRKRLFIIARCDGLPIQWPQRTHGPGREKPYRTAAECIDWTLPCPSIFERSKPLAEATLRRIARGIRRYVIETKQPFIVPASQGKTPGEVVAVSPALIQMGHGERDGQAPRALDPGSPLGTVTAGGNHHALVTAFLAKHYGGGENGVQTPGVAVQLPLGTITAVDHHAVVACHLQRDFGGSTGAALSKPHPTITAGGGGHAAIVASSLVKLKGTCRDGQPVTEPLATIQAQGNHYAEVRAFLLTYYGTEQDPQLGLPLATVTTKDRFAAVTVANTTYAIVDIGMRMLVPKELFMAQGFPGNYVINPQVNGKPLTKTAQVHKCGNAVPPPFSKAIVEANFAMASMRVAA